MKKYTLYILICLIFSNSIFAGIELKLCQPKEQQFFSCTLEKVNKNIAFCGQKSDNLKKDLYFVEFRNGYRENYFPQTKIKSKNFFKYKVYSKKSTKNNKTITDIYTQFKFINKVYQIHEQVVSKNKANKLQIISQKANFSIYKKNTKYKKILHFKCKQDKTKKNLLDGSTASIIQYINEGLFLNTH